MSGFVNSVLTQNMHVKRPVLDKVDERTLYSRLVLQVLRHMHIRFNITWSKLPGLNACCSAQIEEAYVVKYMYTVSFARGPMFAESDFNQKNELKLLLWVSSVSYA